MSMIGPVTINATPWPTSSWAEQAGRSRDSYGPAIGEVHAVRRARITLEHVAARKRIDVLGYLAVEAEGEASTPGDVQCGIPGLDHPGTELHGDVLWSNDPALRWEVRGRRNTAFTTDFDYTSDPGD